MNINFKDLKGKAKDMIHSAATGAGDILISAGEWTKEHPEAATILAGGVSIAVKEGRRINKANRAREEEKRRRRTIYDHSVNTWYDLKRDLTNEDRSRISERKRNGEPLDVILKSMRLI